MMSTCGTQLPEFVNVGTLAPDSRASERQKILMKHFLKKFTFAPLFSGKICIRCIIKWRSQLTIDGCEELGRRKDIVELLKN